MNCLMLFIALVEDIPQGKPWPESGILSGTKCCYMS